MQPGTLKDKDEGKLLAKETGSKTVALPRSSVFSCTANTGAQLTTGPAAVHGSHQPHPPSQTHSFCTQDIPYL